MGIMCILEEISDSLQKDINSLRQVVMYDKKCDRSWERAVAKFDELLIRKNQTDVIIAALEKYCDDQENKEVIAEDLYMSRGSFDPMARLGMDNPKNI